MNDEIESRVPAPRESIPGTTAIGFAEDDHSEILDQLSEYLDGSLAPGDAERMQEHLDGCDRCQAFYRTLRQTVAATRQLPVQGLDEHSRRRLIGDTLNAPT